MRITLLFCGPLCLFFASAGTGAGIVALLLKNIKLVILAIANLGGFIWRFIKGKKRGAEEEPATAEPAPAEEVQS